MLDLVPVDHAAQRSAVLLAGRKSTGPGQEVSEWRRLPVPVPPAWSETVASWVHRLAAVHGLPAGELRAHLGIAWAAPEGGMPGLVPALAAVTVTRPGTWPGRCPNCGYRSRTG